MKKNKIKKYTIKDLTSIRDAIHKMDINNLSFLIILNDKNEITGIFTLGDFRRIVLSGVDINEKVYKYQNKKFYFVKEKTSKKKILSYFNRTIVNFLPVVKNKNLIGIHFRSNFFKKDKNKIVKKSLVKVIIMAGGYGKRLDPVTRILPKPLMPFPSEPIIKVMMDSFFHQGFNEFYLTVNYKHKLIKAYFQDVKLPYNINFIVENKPLGTAGSLNLLKFNKLENVIVTNCDVMLNHNYDQILQHHINKKNHITLVGAMKNFTIPYGVCGFDRQGRLKSIKEKPNYDYLINSGFYIIKSSLFKLIPKNEYYDMDKFILGALKKNKIKIGIYPVHEEALKDIGQWDYYNQSLSRLRNKN